jgi:hypothetical protein
MKNNAAMEDHWTNNPRFAEAKQEQGEPAAITTGMALAFHRALSDGPISKDEAEEIKRGLEAAFSHITAPSKQEQGEPVYQIKVYNSQTAWHDAGLSGYEVTPPNERRILYTKPQPKQEQGEPVAKMTAHRAMYFMERFKREEKLLGPNEQAAVDFVIAMLNTTPQQRKPLTEHELEAAAKKLAECFDYPWEHMPHQGKMEMRGHVLSVLEAAHGIKE